MLPEPLLRPKQSSLERDPGFSDGRKDFFLEFGTAYGFFNLMSGLAMLFASGLAGLLWEQLGAAFTFLAGIVFCLAALGLILLQPRPQN